MSAPLVVSVAPGSAAERAGLRAGDEVLSLNGQVPRDVIEWRFLADESELEIELNRGGLTTTVELAKRAGEPLGAEVSSAVFDRVRTCDNHCEFCFIYQLPSGMRRSLYLKDDDYRLSFLYGNFTTLTRFTEADLERVVTERLSPLNVSIHATDPELRSRMLRNPRGGMSLRWLRALLDHGIEVRGQIVVCPGVNDGAALDGTFAGILDRFPDLAHVAVVPLGLSRFNTEPAMRLHTPAESVAVVEAVEDWQSVFRSAVGHRMVFAADEYYLAAGRAFPEAEAYEGFGMYEDGIGMARSFEREFLGQAETVTAPSSGFFAWVDGAPAAGYRAPRTPSTASTPHVCVSTNDLNGSPCSHEPEVAVRVGRRATPTTSTAVLTGELGAKVLAPLVDGLDRDDVRVVPVVNEFFGGNTAVTGLITGADLVRVLRDSSPAERFLLPDVCLSEGRFLDGLTIDDLPRPVEVVATDGASLRRALEGPR